MDLPFTLNKVGNVVSPFLDWDFVEIFQLILQLFHHNDQVVSLDAAIVANTSVILVIIGKLLCVYFLVVEYQDQNCIKCIRQTSKASAFIDGNYINYNSPGIQETRLHKN